MGIVEPGCGDMLTGTEPMPASDEGRAPGADPQNRYFYPEPSAQDAADRRGGASLGAPYAGGALVPAPPGRFLGAYTYPPRPQASGFPGAGEPFPPTPGAEGYQPGDGYAAPDPRAALYPGPREDYALPAGLEVSGKLRVALNNHLLWSKFNQHQTEMIITKQGRFGSGFVEKEGVVVGEKQDGVVVMGVVMAVMVEVLVTVMMVVGVVTVEMMVVVVVVRMFPFLSFTVAGLEPTSHYRMFVDVVLVDQHHWRYQSGKWVQCGKAEGSMPGISLLGSGGHTFSLRLGAPWWIQEEPPSPCPRLTASQMIVLQSLHKYQPRLHIVEVNDGEPEAACNASNAHIFTFQETQFIAVTAYQNAEITQLKIDNNPFAKGFRENFESMYASVDTSVPSPPGPNCQLLGGDHYSSLLPNQYPVPSRFYPDLTGQAKDVVPQPYWLGPPRDHSYEAEFRAVSMKPAFLPSAPGPTMSYYRSQEVLAPGAGWAVAPQYPPKMGPASWFRSMRTLPMEPGPGASEGRGPEDQGSPSLWTDITPIRPESSDSGLGEGDSKRRRVSPYPSSGDSSSPAGAPSPFDKETEGQFYNYFPN
ncbi:T-box transcription factor TBX21 [Camelus dromedarius]|uniref:T-box transcription factor TBX21 n=1 Tax=Camelus dromedarius TaxID=9838 RepID=A0A5N4D2D5_CAMDR|nr:T-box transcription factor TBX21 [Camelus dromedarius]